MGEVRMLPVAVTGVRLADAITAFLATVGPANTRRGYAAALNRMRQDFGVDADTARLDPALATHIRAAIPLIATPDDTNTTPTPLSQHTPLARAIGELHLALRTTPTDTASADCPVSER